MYGRRSLGASAGANRVRIEASNQVMRAALFVLVLLPGGTTAQAPPIPRAGDDVVRVERDAWLRIDRSWVVAPDDRQRCARAVRLGARVARGARGVLDSPLPRFAGRRSTERVISWAEGPFRRWSHRTMQRLAAVERLVARVHDQGCAVQSVEALAALAAALHYIVDSLREVPIPEELDDELVGGLGDHPLRTTAIDVDEACLALSVSQRAFVPAARACAGRLVVHDAVRYAQDELAPGRTWSPDVPPGPDPAIDL
jgi:hypothetical protein